MITKYHFKNFPIFGKRYNFKTEADSIDNALKKAVNFGIKKNKKSSNEFGDQYMMAKQNLERGHFVITKEQIPEINQSEFKFENTFEKLYDGLINEYKI